MRFALTLMAIGATAAPVGAVAAQDALPRPDPLGHLVREALTHNLALAGERSAAEREDAAVREAGGRFLPTLSFEARYSEQSGALDLGDLVNPAYRTLNQLTGSQSFPTDVSATLPLRQETKLRLVQPLWQPALGPALDAARGARDARWASTDAAARQVAAAAQLAYLDVARAQRVVELYDATLPLVRENLRVAERRVASGSATPEIVSRAAADAAEVEQQRADAARLRDDARRALNDVLGRPLDDDVPLVADSLLRFPLDVTLRDALAAARRGREELRRAGAAEDVAAAQKRLARAASLPGVALALDYGVQGRDYRIAGDADVAMASLVVQWDLFTGGRNGARREQAALDADRAALARRDAERTVELEVRQAYAAARVAESDIATANTRLDAARRTYTLVQRRHR
jgi:outer membrane protein TolC